MSKISFGILGVTSVLSIVIILLVIPLPKFQRAPETSEKVQVVASFYPVAEFTRQVGGDFVSVSTITPPGSEPHDYEPTPRQMQEMYEADAFFYNGAGVDAWADRVAPQAASHGAATVKMSTVIDLIPSTEGDEHDEHDEHESALFDPHFWLDPTLAMHQVTLIAETLAKVDPEHAVVYAENAQIYIQKLEALDRNYAMGLAQCENRTVVTSHAAFAYLAKRYQFEVVPISGISPEEEPSAGDVADIARMAKEQGITYIYFETLVSPKLAETVAREIGAETLVFNPLEGLTPEEIAAGKDYIRVMEDNLQNLKTGMLCR